MGKKDLHILKIEDYEEIEHKGGTLYVQEGIGKGAVVCADNLVVGTPESMHSRTEPVAGEGAQIFSNDVRVNNPHPKDKRIPPHINIKGDVSGCVFGNNEGTIGHTFVGNNLVHTTVSNGNTTKNNFNERVKPQNSACSFVFHGDLAKGVVVDATPMEGNESLGPVLPCNIEARDVGEGVKVITTGNIKVESAAHGSKLESIEGDIALHTARGTHIKTKGKGNINTAHEAVDGSKLYTENGDISVHKMDSTSEAITVSGNIKVRHSNGANISRQNNNKNTGYDILGV